MSGFFSGSFDPFWPHAVLLTAAIVASFADAAGIVMENPQWSFANVLVVGGVAIEAGGSVVRNKQRSSRWKKGLRHALCQTSKYLTLLNI
jgi:hypothetical protein